MIKILTLTIGVLFLNSCANTSTDPITKAAGNAAVDAATKDSSLMTKAMVRQTTGYGTDPVEKAKSDALGKIGL